MTKQLLRNIIIIRGYCRCIFRTLQMLGKILSDLSSFLYTCEGFKTVHYRISFKWGEYSSYSWKHCDLNIVYLIKINKKDWTLLQHSMRLCKFANSEPNSNQQFRNNFTCQNDKRTAIVLMKCIFSMSGFPIFDAKYVLYNLCRTL